MRSQTYMKNYEELGNAESRRNDLPREEPIQLIIQYQVAGPKIVHTQLTLYGQSCFVFTYLEVCVYVCNNN